ncbi:MAG: KpsF/GutQ family sugar-phosphate isomerase [Acidobacteria bacterium]|nr:KpsF/GutQ family sugar-phosphate isomerase [Acidobacteriota bacterium]MCU0255044.1 KpsF/GutQ family sugar-phosphate isomerase [Acidobacteriota bacterium]
MRHPEGRRVIEAEARALGALAARLGPAFDDAVDAILAARGRVVLTGMGKSGLVARKVAATLASTGTPALFLHPAEAIHGDLGMIVRGDVVIALSQSGETAEILSVVEAVRRLGGTLLVMTGRSGSTLGREADLLLDTSVAEEGCPLGLAPMASTTAMLALGDALAAALMVAKGFSEEDFARLHPGGRLGRKLARVRQFMHAGDAVPRVGPETSMGDVVLEMSRKRLGSAAVVDGSGRLLGVVTDGDLRRLLERDPTPLDRTAAEAMTARPVTIAPDALASAALALMEERKITMLPVVASDGTLEGVVQIHDLWGTQLF